MFKKALIAAFIGSSLPAAALELSIQGVGKALIGSDISITRSESLASAKRDALVAAIDKINGPNASRDPKVQGKLDDLVKQIPGSAVANQTVKKASATELETTITLKVDDAWFRTLINDAGLNLNSSGYRILILMDEYHTTPLDRQKPIREVVEYSHDKTATSASASDSTRSSSDYAAGQQKTAVSARADAAAVATNRHGAAAVVASAQVAGKSSSSYVQGSQSASASSASAFDQKNDVVSFKKLVEYLPRNVGPEKTSGTYTALVREASKYNLDLLDADNFKLSVSLKPFSIDDLEKSGANDAMMAKAKRDFKADYLMKGTVYVLDTGKRNGESTCDGVVSLKAYAIEDAVLLVADSQSESAVGNTPEQCANAVGNKLADFVGSKVGARVRDYAKNALMNGKEYNIRLVSSKGQLSGSVRRGFTKVVRGVKGITSEVTQRFADEKEAEYSIKYASATSLEEVLMDALERAQGFEDADSLMLNGTTLKVCLEKPCLK